MSTLTSLSPNDWPEKMNKMRILDSLLRCSICFEYFDVTMLVPRCSHNYCSLCIRKYLIYKKECPTCHVNFTEHELRNNKVVDVILKTYLEVRSELLDLVQQGLAAGKSNSNKTSRAKSCAVSEPDTSTEPQTKVTKPPTPQKKQPPAHLNEYETPVKRMRKSPPASTSPYFPPSSSSSDPNIQAVTPKQKQQIDDSYAECPVCSELIVERKINAHLDVCLSRSEKKESLRHPKEKQSSEEDSSDAVTETQSKGKKTFLRLGRGGKLSKKPSEPSSAEPVTYSQKNTLDRLLSPRRNFEEKSTLGRLLSPRRKPEEKTSNSSEELSTSEYERDDKSDGMTASNILVPSCSQKHKAKPKVEYNFLSEKQIKQILKTCHLSTVGSRQVLIKRHKEFLVLYNSQCDVPNPKSAEAIAKMVEKQENMKERLASKNEVDPSLQVNKHQSEVEIEQFRQNYTKAHQSQFDKLMQQAKENARKRKEQVQLNKVEASGCLSTECSSVTSELQNTINEDNSASDVQNSSGGTQTTEHQHSGDDLSVTENSAMDVQSTRETPRIKRGQSIDELSVIDDSASEASEKAGKLLPDIELTIPAVQQEHDKKLNQSILQEVNEAIDEFDCDDAGSEDLFADIESFDIDDDMNLSEELPGTSEDNALQSEIPLAPSEDSLDFVSEDILQEVQEHEAEMTSVTENERSPVIKVRRSKRKLYEGYDDDNQDNNKQSSRRLRPRYK